jgi:hypothetical protein
MTEANGGQQAAANEGAQQGQQQQGAQGGGQQQVEKKETIIAAGSGQDNGGQQGAGQGEGQGQGQGDGAGQQPKGDWAENWRELLAGEDKEDLKTLVRLSSPVDLWKQNKELRRKLSSGEFKKALPENATPEEKAAWRKENGFPENADGYLESLQLPNGMVLGDADKPFVAELAAAALDTDVPPAAFNGLVTKYYALQEAQAAKQAEEDQAYHDENLAALGKEFGPAFKREVALVNAFVAQYFPPEIASDLLVARGSDGRIIGDNPIFIKALSALAREINPLATLVPGGGADPAKTVNDRLAEIRKFRTENPDKYDADKTMQAEELELIATKQKIEGRGKAA